MLLGVTFHMLWGTNATISASCFWSLQVSRPVEAAAVAMPLQSATAAGLSVTNQTQPVHYAVHGQVPCPGGSCPAAGAEAATDTAAGTACKLPRSTQVAPTFLQALIHSSQPPLQLTTSNSACHIQQTESAIYIRQCLPCTSYSVCHVHHTVSATHTIRASALFAACSFRQWPLCTT